MFTQTGSSKQKEISKDVQVACHIAIWTFCALVFIIITSGCSRRYHDYPVYSPFEVEDYPNHGVGRFKSSYLVDQMEQYYRGTNPGPIGVATFVNLDDLYNTSTFGRMYAEQVISELSMRGFEVVELRHADALNFLADGGELALSRDIAMVRRERELGGMVVGTYSASPIRVYVNARLIDPATSMVLAAGSVEMDKSKEIARMLRGGGFPGSLERIPVKHLGLTTMPLNLNPSYKSQAWEAEERGGVAPAFAAPPPPLKGGVRK